MVSSANYNLAIGQNIGSSVGATGAVKFNEKKQQEEKPEIIEAAKIKFHKIKKSDKYQVNGNWQENYVYTIEVETSSKDIEKRMELMNRYKLITFKLPEKKTFTYLEDCYIIDKIVSPQRYKGAGVKAVQSLLDRSLADKDTEGRIIVIAEIIDGQTSPAGFFYKIGFRFIDNSLNEIMEKWIIKNIETEAPKVTGMMYLPKNNINKLMMYNRNFL